MSVVQVMVALDAAIDVAPTPKITGTPVTVPVTVRVTVAVWTRLPLVAVTVTGYEPGATPGAEMLIVDEPAPVTVAGLNTAVIPLG
jgi:hypothetical protein